MIRLRVDDYPSSKPDEFWKHNFDNYVKFHDTIRKHTEASYLLGVIPKHTTDEDLRKLSELSGIIIGMHGVEHDERFQNEFRPYLTINDRVKVLTAGRSRLRGLVNQEVDIYLPPHNVIDDNTRTALQLSGFSAFTGGPETDLTLPGLFDGSIKYLHSQAPLEYGRSDELLQRGSAKYLMNKMASANPSDWDIYLTLHWTWEYNIGLEHLDRYLAEIYAGHSMEDFSYSSKVLNGQE